MAIKTYPASIESIPEILTEIRQILRGRKYDDRKVLEYELLSEELLLKMIEAATPNQEIQFVFKDRLSVAKMVFTCSGKPILLNDQGDFGVSIISDYAERIHQTRKHGINCISLILETSSTGMSKQIFWAGVLAVLTFLILHVVLTTAQTDWIVNQLLEPLLNIFCKLLQNLAVPIAFISLVAYIINFYDSIEWDRRLTKIAGRFLLTSVIAFLIPFVIVTVLNHFGVFNLAGNYMEAQEFTTIYALGGSVKEVLNNLLPGNLLEIFTLTNPLPMLITAVILGFGINSYSSEGNLKVRSTINTIMELLAQLINLIFSLLPFFFYIALLDVLLYFAVTNWFTDTLTAYGVGIVFVLLLFVIQGLVYVIQLNMTGISFITFWKKYKDMLLENYKIASNIEALPYNIRTFRRKLKSPEKESMVQTILHLGSNINMDGNCLIISAAFFLLCGSYGFQMDALFFIEIMLVVLLLGIGSPNQPGSFTIAMLVINEFIGISEEWYPIIIIFEGIFCKLYSAMNAFGDIVTVVCAVDDDLKKPWAKNVQKALRKRTESGSKCRP